MTSDLMERARANPSTPTIAWTFGFAAEAHRGQADKLGRPYIDHPRAVAALLAPHGREAVLAGLLHDVVEDCGVTYADLRAAGYSDLVITAVMAVSWAHKDETYDELIARAAAHPLGRHVKLADNTHNTWPARVRALNELLGEDNKGKAEEMAAKYARARATLLAAGATLEPDCSQVFSLEADPLPCPVLSESTGLWCAKPVQHGWTPAEGHGGGHWWTSWQVKLMMDGGHYDATAAVSGEPFDGHLPENCPGPDDCPYWWYLGRDQRRTVEQHLAGRQ